MERKESFGKKQISQDLENLATTSLVDYILLIFGMIVGVGYLCMIALYNPLSEIVRFFGIFVCAGICMLFLFAIVCIIARSFYLRRLAKLKNYFIVQDELQCDGAYCPVRKIRWIDFGVVRQRRAKSRLTFRCFGKYYIPKGRYYSWSKKHSVHASGLYDTAVPGDTFYIVTDDGKTPLMVYNTKFFEYKGDKEGNAL